MWAAKLPGEGPKMYDIAEAFRWAPWEPDAPSGGDGLVVFGLGRFWEMRRGWDFFGEEVNSNWNHGSLFMFWRVWKGPYRGKKKQTNRKTKKNTWKGPGNFGAQVLPERRASYGVFLPIPVSFHGSVLFCFQRPSAFGLLRGDASRANLSCFEADWSDSQSAQPHT